MIRQKMLPVALSLMLLTVASSVMADDKSVVKTFYDFLSNPASEQAAGAFKAAAVSEWQSIGDYSGESKNRDQFIGQVSGLFAKLMPDLNWEIQEMIQEGDKVVVRGRATGTPKGPLFGVDGMGKSFDILTIDIHTVEDGKIVRSYHLEDWAGALQQLKSK